MSDFNQTTTFNVDYADGNTLAKVDYEPEDGYLVYLGDTDNFIERDALIAIHEMLGRVIKETEK